MANSKEIPWKRISVEAAAVVVSILLAFSIDAWWEDLQDRKEESQLLTDLINEFEANRDRLMAVTESHRIRSKRLRTLIEEAATELGTLTADDLDGLADQVLTNPIFTAEKGVMERALSGNGLSLIEDTNLRASLAGFWPKFGYYFKNQWIVIDNVVFSRQVVFETGALVWQRFSEREELDSTSMWSDELTTEETNTLKYFMVTEFMSKLMMKQGERMLAEIDIILAELRSARSK